MAAASKPTLGCNMAPVWRQRFGNIVRDIRLNRDLTQREVAAMLGITTGMVSGIEIGAVSFPPERIKQFCDLTETDLADFARKYLRHANPWAYTALGIASPAEVHSINTEIQSVTSSTTKRRGPRA